MEKVYLPDYKGGSIVNLMSSIAHAFDAKHPYPELRALSSSELKKYKNIVLIIIDGLGYEHLIKKQDYFLKNKIKAKITSVFPPTTAAGVSTFFFGLPVQQHGLTAWYMFLKELGVLARILPFNPRIGGPSFKEEGYSISDIIDIPAFTSKINAKSHIIQTKYLLKTEYTRITSKKAKLRGYKNLKEFFNQTEKSIKEKSSKKYICAYWPNLDGFAHDKGVGSKQYEKHLRELDKNFKNFSDRIKGTKTLLIITADHGLINSNEKEIIKLEDHPKLKECLSMPLCGEGRLPYCYVHPSKSQEFEDYIKNNLSKYCWMFKSQELIKRNFYGLGKPNPRLFDRIGDYVLIMKENYLLKDKIEKRKEFHVGNHGGVSKEEMLVPLIVINT